MKRVKQINESKQLILEGLMTLMTQEDFEAIKITDIAETAGVTRMTLYRHFKEKEDIIIYAFEQNLVHVITQLEGIDEPTLYDLLCLRFRILKESKFTKVLTKQKKYNKLFQSLGNQFVHHFNEFLPTTMDPYDIAFITGGVDAMTEKWMTDGMVESSMVMAKKCLRAFDAFQQTEL